MTVSTLIKKLQLSLHNNGKKRYISCNLTQVKHKALEMFNPRWHMMDDYCKERHIPFGIVNQPRVLREEVKQQKLYYII